MSIKLKCIDNFGVGGLTKNKIYEGDYVNNGTEVLVETDDDNATSLYDMKRFVPSVVADTLTEENEKLKDRIKELEKSLNEQKTKEKPFVELNQKYFYIDSGFRVQGMMYGEDYFSKLLKKSGNMYPYTSENKDKVFKEVSLIAERRKLQSEMEMFAKLNNKCEIDWNDRKQEKWYLYVDCHNKELGIGCYLYCRFMNETYFASEEIAKKALDKFGDRIKRLYL